MEHNRVVKFESGVNFQFNGGSESLFCDPIRREIAELESWVAQLEGIARPGQKIIIDALPKSKYLPKLGRRNVRAAGCKTIVYDDVHGRSGFVAQWDALVSRVSTIAEVRGWDR